MLFSLDMHYNTNQNLWHIKLLQDAFSYLIIVSGIYAAMKPASEDAQFNPAAGFISGKLVDEPSFFGAICRKKTSNKNYLTEKYPTCRKTHFFCE